MDEDEEQGEYNTWMHMAANHLLAANECIRTAQQWAPDGHCWEWFKSRIGFFEQTAEEISPDGNDWPKETAEIYDFITQQKVNQ
jgi:hypothetical protein